VGMDVISPDRWVYGVSRDPDTHSGRSGGGRRAGGRR